MIAQLIEVLNIAAETLPVDTRYGWAQIIDGRPRVHVGNGQWVEVAQDTNGTWSYVRANGQARVEPVDIGEPCSGVKLRLPLRLVALVDRSACDELPGLLVQTAASIRQARKQFVAASQAVSVTFSSILWQVGGFESQEFQPVPNIPTDKALIAIDILMEVDGREDCFDGCGTLTDVVCAIIQRASNAKVAECLGSERLAELCDTTPIECDPLEWTLKDSEGNTLDTGEVEDPCGETLEVIAPDATVTRDGSPFGTVPSGGTIDVPCVEECPLEVTFDGLALTTVEDACETGTLALDCNSTLPFARVEDGATRSGNYLPVGDDYVKDVDHKFEYITDRWVLVQPGSDIQAAPGPSSEAPWEADWSGTSITVTQGTIAEYCDDCPTCPLEVTINDAEFTTVDDACAAPLLNIRVSSTDNDPVGSLIGGKWVIADSPISVDGTPELNLPAEDALNITINDGTSNVPAVSVDTSTPGEMAIEIAPCPTLCDQLGDVPVADIKEDVLDCLDCDQKIAATQDLVFVTKSAITCMETEIQTWDLNLWLDALDSATLFDAVSGGSTPAIGAAVARWEDKSGNGYNVDQATAGFRPIRRSGGIEFDGTDDGLGRATATNLLRNVSGATLVVMALKTAAQSGIQTYLQHSISGSSNGRALIGFSNGNEPRCGGRRLDGDSFESITSATPVSLLVPHVQIGRFDYANNRLDLYLNDTVTPVATSTTFQIANPGANTSNTQSDELNVGSYAPNVLNRTACLMQAAMIFHTALTEAQRTLLKQYLLLKYPAIPS